MDDLILSELEADGLLIATIDMPGRTMNVFSADLIDALEALVDRVESDPAVRSCVVTSGKSSFLAGADLVMVRGFCDEARSASHAAMFERCGRLGRLFVRLEESAKPWVAAVNGIALGGGLELALACRVRLVADGPRIQLGVPEVRWGLLPGAGGTQRLPRLVGRGRALDLMLTGRQVPADEALAMGLVDRLTSGDVIDGALALAGQLTAASLPAQRAVTQAVDVALDRPLADGLSYEAELVQELFTHGEAAEGIKAFLEKRPPRFS